MTNNMQERFREKFTVVPMHHETDKERILHELVYPEDIINFIQSEIDLAVAKREKEIVKMILSRPVFKTFNDYPQGDENGAVVMESRQAN